MNAIVFDGQQAALNREKQLKEQIAALPFTPRLMSFVVNEDEGSQLYTRLKFEAAARVGIEFDRHDFGITESTAHLQEVIASACQRQDCHGIMIQKPSKRVWKEHHQWKHRGDFQQWWRSLTGALMYEKDVDCLSMRCLDAVTNGSWQIVPATVKGILDIIEEAMSTPERQLVLTDSGRLAQKQLAGLSAAVVGRSDIVGRPLAAVLAQHGAKVRVVGSGTDDLGKAIVSAGLVVSATGVKNLITADIVKPGAIVIDVGAPGPDVDFDKVKNEASFITPVPNGVGPMTVISLLENLYQLAIGRHAQIA